MSAPRLPRRVKTSAAPDGVERRRGPDRRKRIAKGLVTGSINPQRRQSRRAGDHGITHLDWHAARWLGVALLILLLSCADALLTLALMRHGATEINPVMAPLVEGTGRGFALWKLGLTAVGVVVLTLLAPFRILGRVPVGVLLYLTLAGYIVLVAYELWLLEQLVFVNPVS